MQLRIVIANVFFPVLKIHYTLLIFDFQSNHFLLD